jgi:hypothetical protein
MSKKQITVYAETAGLGRVCEGPTAVSPEKTRRCSMPRRVGLLEWAKTREIGLPLHLAPTYVARAKQGNVAVYFVRFCSCCDF